MAADSRMFSVNNPTTDAFLRRGVRPGTRAGVSSHSQAAVCTSKALFMGPRSCQSDYIHFCRDIKGLLGKLLCN